MSSSIRPIETRIPMGRAVGNAIRRRIWGSMFAPHQRELGPFFLDPRDHIGAERIIMGDWYEGSLLAVLADVIDRLDLGRGTALDVGANIGNHACFFARRFRHLVCIEPGTTASLVLEANLSLSGLRNFDIHRVALGSEERFGVLDRVSGQNLGSSVVRLVDPGGDGEFEILRGDRLLQRSGVDDLTFVKIDVEGAEVGVIEGLAETLRAQTPIVCVEVLEEPRWIEVRRLLGQVGYDRWLAMTPELETKGFLARAWATLRGKRLSLKPLSPTFRDGGYDMILCMTNAQAERLTR
jgi:FkbM family methyltransferase